MYKIKYNKIMWKNIYYMLCYSVKYLAELGLVEADFDNITGINDLLARLLVKAHEYTSKYSSLIEYNTFERVGTNPVGAIKVYMSFTSGKYAQGKLFYTEDTLDINSIYNRIIKYAYELLLRSDGIADDKIDKGVRNRISYLFQDVVCAGPLGDDELDLIISERFDYSELPNWSKPVVAASLVVIRSHIYSDNGRSKIIYGFKNYEQLNLIFEEFVRNYLTERMSKDNYGQLLRPVYKVAGSGSLRLDALVQHNQKYLVIDTKWYNSSIPDKDNENQVYRYVGETPSNLRSFSDKTLDDTSLAGLLIYAKANGMYISNKKTESTMVGISIPIFFESIDLDLDFEELKERLYSLVRQTIDNKMPEVTKKIQSK